MSTDSETNIDDEVFESTEEEIIASDSETNDGVINNFENITISTTSTTEDLSMVKVASSSETNNMFLTATDSDVFPASLSELLQKLQLASTSEVISTESNIDESLFGEISSKIGKRPIWITSHHCNDWGEVPIALNAGCNAIEVDILPESFEGKWWGPARYAIYREPVNFWLAHSSVNRRKDMNIANIIEDAWKYQGPSGEHLCLIILDIKKAKTVVPLSEEIHKVYDFYYKEYSARIREEWDKASPERRRSLINPESVGKKLYIIYSIPNSSDMRNFHPGFGLNLRDNEGICVDQSVDVQNIEQEYRHFGYNNCWFGNGYESSIPWSKSYMKTSGKIESIRQAVRLRDGDSPFIQPSPIKKVETWTVRDPDDVRNALFVWGCDSVMIGDQLRETGVINDIKSQFDRNNAYMATIDDNPFERTPRYNVDFFGKDGTLLCSKEYGIGERLSTQTPEIFIPVIPNKIFVGWIDMDNGKSVDPDVRIKKNAQYIAKYREDTSKPNYTITFHCGSYAYERIYEEGDDVEVPDISYYIEDGHIFDGWYEEPTYENKVYTFPPVTSDKDYYAKTDRLKKYDICFVLNGKEYLFECEHGEKPVFSLSIDDKIPAGYEFVGWEPAIDIATKDTEYRAIFKLKEKVYLYINAKGGKDIPAIPVPKGERPEPPRDCPERSGYDFVGYYQDEACTIPYEFDPLYENKTIYCKWAIIQYKIKWIIDGNIEEEIVNAGTMPVHATPSKLGYIFTGWVPNVEEAYRDMIYTANFASEPHVTSYAVLFDTLGGSLVDMQIVAEGRKAQKPIYNPIKSGYVFDGWYDNVDCTGSQFDFNTPIMSFTTLYAKWKAIKYTITWKELQKTSAGLVDLTSTQEVPYGILPDKTPSPLEGYAFIGWKPDLVPASENATYVAEYIVDTPVYHVVDFDPMGGVASPSYLIIKNNERIVNIPEATRTGYIFDGWYDNKECTGSPFDFNTPITDAGLVLYAKWTGIPHKVIWKKDGNIIASASYLYGEMPDWGKDCGADVEKAGYEFIGWSPEVETVGLETEYTYEAQYKMITVQIHYVTFDTKGGSFVNMQIIKNGEKASTPSVVPIKTGYTFTKWYKDESCTVDFNFDTETINAATTIYSGWEANTYTVYWLKDNIVVASNSCSFGAVPVFPTDKEEAFKKMGYIRTGWNPLITMIDEYSSEEIYYEAVYSESTDGRKWVTFDTRGGSAITSQHVIIGNQAIKPANPTMKNYEFKDWYVNIECTYPYDFYTPVTDDITIYAGWTYKPEPTPAPTPTPTSRSRNSGGGGSGGGSISRGLGNGLNNTKENAIACQKTGIMNVPANNFWVYNQIDNTWEMRVVVGGITAPLTDGFYKVNDQVYYFDIYGRLTTGWVKDLLGNYFYFEPKDNSNMCAMATGWRTIDGKNYNFGLDGVLLSSN